MSKREVRKEVLQTRKGLAAEDVRRLSRKVHENLLSLSEFGTAKVIASYVAKRDEVQTDEILRQALESGKKVIVPRSDLSSVRLRFHEIRSLAELLPGAFGIPEPPTGSPTVPLADADVVLVPMVAWDLEGHRVGYGKGYFDRELKSRGDALGVGLAFEFQRRDSLPATPTDVPMDAVVTDGRVVRFGRNSC
ncbi:MAG TPA: 5-formyltetrahydrofolate cyclo-ligase [Nitrososphaerales archaeon]|nr:5-formyltetrahydrofolate cyclo-ligase [Nitrososphaerales archaeon]